MPTPFSVVIPVHNGAAFLGRTLDALLASSLSPEQIIVVDDASTDGSIAIANARGAECERLEKQSGAGAARNVGASRASGEILVFVDADVCVHADALARIVNILDCRPDLAAVFGSYDTAPPADSWVSWFRNMLHAYTHQTGRREAKTFWTGLGAVRRQAFLRCGGFPEGVPLEDVAFGVRLIGDGGEIELAPEIQGTHLKNWTLWSMVRTDIWRRGVPWMRMALAGMGLANDLNTRAEQRLSVALACLIALLTIAAPFTALALYAFAATLSLYVLLNGPFLRFLARHGGVGRALLSVPLLWIYHLCCGASVILGVFEHLVTARVATSYPARASASRPNSQM